MLGVLIKTFTIFHFFNAEQTFCEKDGFEKMWLTFYGRVHDVKKKPLNECKQIANLMIECCEKTFDDYLKFADRYIQARKDHMIISATTGNLLSILTLLHAEGGGIT